MENAIFEASAFIAINRFNDYDLGMLILHNIGLISGEKKLILGKEQYQRNFLQSLLEVKLSVSGALNTLSSHKDKDECVVFNASCGSFMFSIKDGSENIEDIDDLRKFSKDYDSHCVKLCREALAEQDEKKLLIAFGALGKMRLHDGLWRDLIAVTVDSIESGGIDTKGMNEFTAKTLIDMYLEVGEK